VPNPKPIIDPRRDLKLFGIVLAIILAGMWLGVLLNAPSLLTSHWLVGVCLLNKTPTNTTYVITVNVNTTLYSISTNTNCTITPSPPLTGPAIARLTCKAPLEHIAFSTSGGIIVFNGTGIGECPS
jgi:hypothetical protein